MKKTIILLLLINSINTLSAQSITGQLKAHAGQQLTLTGFNNYNTAELVKTTADSLGNFTLNYPKTYQGMAFLKSQDHNNLLLLLDQPLLNIKGTHLIERDSLVFNNTEHKLFFGYAKAQEQRSNALSAWKFLENLYNKQGVLFKQKRVKKQIVKEQKRIAKENANFVKNLKQNSYLAWFIPKRTLIQETNTIIQKETHRIPQAIAQFRNTNFNNKNFKTSGLLKDYIQGHYFLLENMGQPLDSVYKQMNVSTDYLIDNLSVNDSLLNTVSGNLFKLFEKRSLISAAAHLSNQLLADNQCTINDSLANSMQKYVTLKKGNTAPDIQLTDRKLSDIKKPVLLVFGESSCPHCKDEALKLLKYYDTWKTKKELAVVYVSLDTNKEAYKTAYQNAPWQMYCNFKGWDTQAAKDYFVNGTPTYILLDKDLKILVHPSSLAQVDAWVNYSINP